MLEIAAEHLVGIVVFCIGILFIYGGFKHWDGWDPDHFIIASGLVVGSIMILVSFILFGLIIPL